MGKMMVVEKLEARLKTNEPRNKGAQLRGTLRMSTKQSKDDVLFHLLGTVVERKVEGGRDVFGRVVDEELDVLLESIEVNRFDILLVLPHAMLQR